MVVTVLTSDEDPAGTVVQYAAQVDRVGIPGSLNGKGIHRKLGEPFSVHRLPSKGH